MSAAGAKLEWRKIMRKFLIAVGTLIIVAGTPVLTQAQQATAKNLAPVKPMTAAPKSATPGSQWYHYSTVRVITEGVSSRGCSANDWGCMENLCKQDIDPSATLEGGGCEQWDLGTRFMCVFGCTAWKETTPSTP
jgi:hypothetical protein